jgi:hypothetical protein
MKRRMGFVSNSSSSSFVVGHESDALRLTSETDLDEQTRKPLEPLAELETYILEEIKNWRIQ